MSWEHDSHDGLPYRFALPHGYDPRSERYPVVVFLHGSRERGKDNQAHLVNGVQSLVGAAIVVAPQCPADDTWGGSWYGGDSRTQRAVASLVAELGRRRSVDPQRISLVGYSMGAIGLWAIVERYPALFCAGVPIAGDLDPRSADGLAAFPLWAFHGERDRVVTNLNVRAVARRMHERGATSFRYTEFPGVGHDSWKPAFAEGALLPWLLAQRR